MNYIKHKKRNDSYRQKEYIPLNGIYAIPSLTSQEVIKHYQGKLIVA